MMPEQLWIMLLFLVVVLVNLITGFLKRRRERGTVDERKYVSQPAARSRPTPPRAVATSPRLDVSPPAPLRHRRVKLGRADLRRAIVVMTLLGPPRALADERRDAAAD